AGSDPRALDEARLEEQLRIGQQRTSRSLRSHFAIVARATRAGTTTTRTEPEPRRHEEIRRTRRNVCVRFSTKVFFVDLRVFVSSWFRLSSCLGGSGPRQMASEAVARSPILSIVTSAGGERATCSASRA